MFSRLSFRSVRSLSAALVVAALVIALAVPAQAAPRQESSTVGPLASFVSWLQEWLRPASVLDDSSDPAPTPDQAYQKTGQCMDPNGQPMPCPEDD